MHICMHTIYIYIYISCTHIIGYAPHKGGPTKQTHAFAEAVAGWARAVADMIQYAIVTHIMIL